jgi:soluble lytic murein transglycosylase
MFIIRLTLLFLLCSSIVLAQTSNEPRREQIRIALENKNFEAALAELQAFRQAEPKIFEINNYDYLLGRVAKRQNNLAIAIASFQSVVKRNSILSKYALWHLSQIMRASGNLMLERVYLQQLSILVPEGLLSGVTKFRLAESFYKSRDFQATIKTLQNHDEVPSSKFQVPSSKTGLPKSITQNRQTLVLLGNAFLRSGNIESARKAFNELLSTIPNANMPDDFALQAVRGLDEIDSAKPTDFDRIAPVLSEDEHQRRAFVYQFNRNFAQAALHYRAIIERYPNGANKPTVLFQLGRMASQQDRYDEAITLFERVQGEFPAHSAARDALSHEAAAYAKSGNIDGAVNLYRTFIQKYVENTNNTTNKIENPERPFLNIIDALRDRGLETDALEWVRITRERFKNQLPAAQALFSQARVHLAQGNWNASLRDLSELESISDTGGTHVPGGTDKTEITFLKAYAFEQLGRYSEAVETYLAIPDGRGEYYGGRATERLKALSEREQSRELVVARFNSFRAAAVQALAVKDTERARQNVQNALRLTNDAAAHGEMLDVLKQIYAVLPAYKNVPNASLLLLGRQKIIEKPQKIVKSNYHKALADELLFLNLYDEAAPELEAVYSSQLESKDRKPKNENQTAFTLAVLYKRGDLAHRAVTFAEPLWKNVPSDYFLEAAPRESIELLYPSPYADFLRDSAIPRNLDSRFVLSIMRQESRYRPDVKSNAAARGLMQFIPSTAAQIANQLDQTDFSQNDLYNPATAILFGSQYLSNIYRQFSNQPQAVAAAYNGGESNMMRWFLRSRSTDPDRYVSEIQYPQSKDYVFKVLANYRAYKTLYAALRPAMELITEN